MATSASSIIAQLQEILRDDQPGNVGVLYKTQEALAWINDAQLTLCLVRADAKTSIQAMQLAEGTKQTIPLTARRLIGLTRNMGGGSVPGRAIRGPVPQEDVDAYDPSWHTKTGTEVIEYVYSKETEKIFYVSPGAASTFWIEGKFAMYPLAVANTTDNIDLSDIYVPAIIEWCLYRFFSRDDERTPNWTRAGRHKDIFMELMGIKRKADAAVSPDILEFK